MYPREREAEAPGVDASGTGAAPTTEDPSPRLDITSLDLGGDVVFVTDRDGRIVEVNDAFVRVTGYSRSEAIGSTPRLLSSGFQDDAFYEDLWRTILAGQVWEGQLIDRRRDGMLRTHRATISPIRDETGQITHFLAVERDVSGELGRQVATGSTGLLHTDATGRCVYADGRAAALLDRPPSELLGDGLVSCLYADDADAMREVIAMAVERGREHRLDVRTQADRWLHLEIAPLMVASGGVIGATLSVEDITDQVATHRELARRDAFIDSILDALDDPIAVVGSDGRVIALNRAWRERAAEQAGPQGTEPSFHDLTTAHVGDDLLSRARMAAAAGDEQARAVLEDLARTLNGMSAGRQRDVGIQVSLLGWEEGGAVLRWR